MSDYQYKMVNGELVSLTPEEIAELEQRDSEFVPMQPQPPIDQGTRANQRLDAGIAAAQSSLDAAARASTPKSKSTDDRIAALQAQIDSLEAAISDMLVAQTGPTPRIN